MRFTRTLLGVLLVSGCGRLSDKTPMVLGASFVLRHGICGASSEYEVDTRAWTIQGKRTTGVFDPQSARPAVRLLSCANPTSTRTVAIERPTSIPEHLRVAIEESLSELTLRVYPSEKGSPVCPSNPAGHTWDPLTLEIEGTAYSTAQGSCQALVVPPGSKLREQLQSAFDSLGPRERPAEGEPQPVPFRCGNE